MQPRLRSSGNSTPTQAELEAAWETNQALMARNAELDAELAGLEDRAEASVLHMGQMRRVLSQLKAHKVQLLSLITEGNTFRILLDVVRWRAAHTLALIAAWLCFDVATAVVTWRISMMRMKEVLSALFQSHDADH